MVSLTATLEHFIEKRESGPVHKAVRLAGQRLFDHVVPRDEHHPLTALPQAEQGAVLLGELNKNE